MTEPRRPVLASVLGAGLMLAVASCSHLTPLGPDPAATVPQPLHLRSPLVLRPMQMEQPTPAGACPSGSVALSGGPGQCYRDAGAPVTVTSAAVSPVTSFQPAPPGQQPVPTQYGFWITVPAADVPAVTAVIPAPPPTHGGGPVASSVPMDGAPVFGISVAGRTWIPVGFSTPSSTGQLEIMLSSRTQALQLQRALAPAS